MLELLNLELELIEPWMPGGTFTTTAASSDALVQGAVIQTDRTAFVAATVVSPQSNCRGRPAERLGIARCAGRTRLE